ncbi:MAG: Na/Pi symporter [Proteobacteria bacterium]|nr:Na/Pi symporter [Pseudomonadota bacterium]MDA0993027.1 Na/Pi symporter [Pseudomonadota bacterium]
MNEEIDLWRIAAGLGLFLFGMHQLEQSLTLLAGRRFKKFLREHTVHPVKGVLAGAVSTAALQSSSVVSLIVLAFVGTGIISLASAIGIVFGSNLGTTATGWIVATVGFKLDIEAIALPLVGIGGLGVVWSRAGSRRAGFSHLVAGLGLMLMGLEFMKSGAISATALFDPANLSAYPPIVFLIVGFLVTALIQSSSATIMITLSALYAGAIPLTSAAAVAIGADLGTSITALLGALVGSMDKRRVAIAIVIFNVVTDAIAFIALGPLLLFITVIIGLSNPLLALVAFHSLFNLIGIIIFLPLVGVMSRQLAKRFRDTGDSLLHHLRDADFAVPEAAIENVSRETLRLIDQAAALNQFSFNLPITRSFYDSALDRKGVPLFGDEPSYSTGYDGVKQLEGAILSHVMRLQEVSLNTEESARLGQIIVAIRQAVHAAKYLKDTHHDLQAFQESVDDHFNAWFGRFRDAADEFYESLSALSFAQSSSHRFEMLVELKSKNEEIHATLRKEIYREVTARELSELQISTLLNVNREFYLSSQSLLAALAEALLDTHGATDFESLPVGV